MNDPRYLKLLRDDLRKDLTEFTDATIDDLCRRANVGAGRDGYSGGGDGGRHSKGGDPTMSVGLALVEHGALPDPIGALIDKAFHDLETARQALRVAANAARKVMLIAPPTAAELAARKTGVGDCQACGHNCTGVGDDRLRSGYCPKDWKAWKRAGMPDRFQFERERKATA